VPAIFRRELFQDLLAVEGDQGARKILEKYATRAGVVDFPGGELDIDTPRDLEMLRRS
jgi:molybdenum cofactor cytidylyltransferase